MAYSDGKDVTLECAVRAWPKPIVYWNKTGPGGGVILSRGRFEVSESSPRAGELVSTLTVRVASEAEAGKYTCLAKNSLGDDKAVVRIHSKEACRRVAH